MTFPKVSIFSKNAEGTRTIDEALSQTDMNWTVEKQQAYHNGHEVPGQFAIVRSDTGRPIGDYVGNKYKPVQNHTILATPQDMIDADPTGNTQFSTIGVYDGGSKFFASVNLGRPSEITPGDVLEWYYVVSTSHDGSEGIRQLVTSVRPVCDNTRQMGIREAKGEGCYYNIRHTESAEERLAQSREVFAQTLYTRDEMVATLKDLATVQLTREMRHAIEDALFPMKTAEELANAKRKDNGMQQRRDLFEQLFEYNDGDAFPLIRGTAYNAVQAVDELTDHYEKVVRTAGRTGQAEYEIRQEKAIFGTGSTFKERALAVILEATAYAPRRAMPVQFAMGAAAPQFTDNASLLSSMLN